MSKLYVADEKTALPLQNSIPLILGRVTPFALYIGFLVLASALSGLWPQLDLRWLYPLKISFVLVALAWFWSEYAELRDLRLTPTDFLIALVAGIAVFVLWINLDQSWVVMGELDAGKGFDPRDAGSAQINWVLALSRIFGAAIVVPVMEELFWRSFIMRWLDRAAFLSLAPASVRLGSLVISSVVFGLEHQQWLAGIIAGLAYGEIYRRSGKLSSPILAHALTNLLLGLWVLSTGNWQYW